MSRTRFFKNLSLLVFLSLFTNVSYAAKPSMAILDFRNTTSAYWWNLDVARELSGMLNNELASGNHFTLVERRKLASILREQDLVESGRISGDRAAKMGKMTGAQYLVTATVSAFENNIQKAGGGISFKGISLGGKKKKAYIAVDLRVIDSTSGEVVQTRTVEARSGGLGLGIGVRRNGFGGALASEKKTPAGRAIRAVVVEIANYLECSMVKQDGCMAKFDAKEEKRRQSLIDSIELY